MVVDKATKTLALEDFLLLRFCDLSFTRHFLRLHDSSGGPGGLPPGRTRLESDVEARYFLRCSVGTSREKVDACRRRGCSEDL
jgi:hypothetical protein